MQLLNHQRFFLVGIKGVAMTSIAQCLLDAGKEVSGSDVAETFVTQPILERLHIPVQSIQELPDFTQLSIDAVIYTAAHQGIDNPQVQAALRLGLPIYSQAVALGNFFNQQQGFAVCGVGGKSTVSAMLSFVLEQLVPNQVSFSVGVGEILDMDRTGRYRPAARYFVAEADEYVIDPHAQAKGQPITPRFAFLQPFATICTNLRFDHPDVYPDFAATKETFRKFFQQLKPNGLLMINGDNEDLVALSQQLGRDDIHIKTFGKGSQNDYRLDDFDLALLVPGEFNRLNALAALGTLLELGFTKSDVLQALTRFRSTKRRFELVKKTDQAVHFDDYAHHPSEILAVIDTLNQEFPNRKKLIAFQPHTFSRTRQLFDGFVDALASHTQDGDEVLLIDIFPSAREAYDSEMNCDLLVEAIKSKYPQCSIQNLHTITALANYVQTTLHQLFITIGAGDIYLAHDLL
jgi:UDP-N-acetylmuramate--alanine ligase